MSGPNKKCCSLQNQICELYRMVNILHSQNTAKDMAIQDLVTRIGNVESQLIPIPNNVSLNLPQEITPYSVSQFIPNTFNIGMLNGIIPPNVSINFQFNGDSTLPRTITNNTNTNMNISQSFTWNGGQKFTIIATGTLNQNGYVNVVFSK